MEKLQVQTPTEKQNLLAMCIEPVLATCTYPIGDCGRITGVQGTPSRTKISCGGRRDGICNELDLGKPTDNLQTDKGAWVWDHTKPKYDSWPRMAKSI